jgi:hypothetical protein
MVEPIGGVAEILERIVNRKHHPLHPDLGDRIDQRRRAEMA